MSAPHFWDKAENSTSVVKELKRLKALVEPWNNASQKYQELRELAEITKGEDQDLITALNANIEILSGELERLEFSAMLGGELDKNNAILSLSLIHI